MTRFAILLPLAVFGLLWWLTTVHRNTLGLERLSRRGTFVVAFVQLEAILVLITEALSVGDHMTRWSVALAYVVVALILIVTLVATVDSAVLRDQVRAVGARGVVARLRHCPVAVVVIVGAMVAVLGVLVVVGWLDVPNNSDSLVYHLPRVEHWIQDRSVHHFATHYTAQLEFSPLHEFNMLHVRLLGRAERLEGYVQLGGLVVAAVGASEVARLLRGNAEVQAAAAFVFAVVPSAVLQATSTQNDVFSAAISVAVFVLLLGWTATVRWMPAAVGLGIAIGLSGLVKGGMPLLIGPAVVLLGGRIVWLAHREHGWAGALRRAAPAAVSVIVCAVAIVGPHLVRNRELFGTFTGPVSDSTIDESFELRPMIGNVIRNVAVNFRIGDGDGGLDTWVQHVALDTGRRAYDAVGASQDDPRYVIGALDDAFARGDYGTYERTEEFGANAWHVLLLLATTVFFVVQALRGRRDARLPLLIIGGLCVGFVAFTATARWSLFVSRYQLPLLVIWAPLIALALGQLHRYALRAVVVLLGIAIVPQLLDNASRSLLHRPGPQPSDLSAYFVHPGGDGFFVAPGDYVLARDAIARSGCTRLGIGNWVLLEYPIWAGLDHARWHGQIEHIDVQNASRVLEQRDFAPCAIITQRVGRSAVETPSGWTDQKFGDLGVSFAPGFVP